MKILLLVFSIVLILTSGCLNKQEGGPTPADKEPEITQTTSPTVTPTDDTEIKQKLTGLAKENLSQILNVKAEDIMEVNIEKASWPNSSMGYGNPNESYLPVEIIGYKIFLQYNETIYEYHAGDERVIPPLEIS